MDTREVSPRPIVFRHALTATEDPSAVLIYDERNKLYRVDLGREGVYVVKSFRKPSFINSFVYAHLRPSKAARSYYHARRLSDLGVGTPEPLGYAELLAGGRLADSYYASAALSGYDHLRRLMNGEVEDDRLMNAMLDFIVGLHGKGVLHIDLSPGNVLYRELANGAYDFQLVDLNRMRFGLLSARERYRNLGLLAPGRPLCRRIAEMYAIRSGESPREVCRCALAVGDKFFNGKMRKHFIRNECRRRGRLMGALYALGVLFAFYLCIGFPGRRWLSGAERIYAKHLFRHDNRGYYAAYFTSFVQSNTKEFLDECR